MATTNKATIWWLVNGDGVMLGSDRMTNGQLLWFHSLEVGRAVARRWAEGLRLMGLDVIFQEAVA